MLFVTLLALRLIRKSFKDLADLIRRVSTRLGAEGYPLPWRTPGYDATFMDAFLSGAKRLVKGRIVTRARVPLSTSHLFCIVLALIPPAYQSLGGPDHRRNNYLSIACTITAMLFLADGLRGGELFTEVQKNHTKKADRKIPRIGSLVLYFKDVEFGQRFSDFNNKREQILLLGKMMNDLSCYIILHVFFTKPGRHRRIALRHHHLFNSCILCPLCHLGHYLAYRLKYNTTPLSKNSHLFIFEGVGGVWYPMTSAIFNSTLLKVCADLGLFKVTQSNFKIGILTELWHTSIMDILPFRPDLRFFLAVADHRTDYHQNYIIPDLLTICTCLQQVREINLVRFLVYLSGEERNRLMLKMCQLLPRPAKDTSNSPLQKGWSEAEYKKNAVRSLNPQLQHTIPCNTHSAP